MPLGRAHGLPSCLPGRIVASGREGGPLPWNGQVHRFQQRLGFIDRIVLLCGIGLRPVRFDRGLIGRILVGRLGRFHHIRLDFGNLFGLDLPQRCLDPLRRGRRLGLGLLRRDLLVPRQRGHGLRRQRDGNGSRRLRACRLGRRRSQGPTPRPRYGRTASPTRPRSKARAAPRRGGRAAMSQQRRDSRSRIDFRSAGSGRLRARLAGGRAGGGDGRPAPPARPSIGAPEPPVCRASGAGARWSRHPGRQEPPTYSLHRAKGSSRPSTRHRARPDRHAGRCGLAGRPVSMHRAPPPVHDARAAPRPGSGPAGASDRAGRRGVPTVAPSRQAGRP